MSSEEARRPNLGLALLLAWVGCDPGRPQDGAHSAPMRLPPTATFSTALCTLAEPESQEVRITAEPFAQSSTFSYPLRFDGSHLYVETGETRFQRFSLDTGRSEGEHDLGVTRSRMLFQVAGSDAQWTYLWGVSNIETTSERKQELIAVDFARGVDRTVLSEGSTNPAPRVPYLVDEEAIYWFEFRDGHAHDLVRTDKRGLEREVLVTGEEIGIPVADAGYLYFLRWERPDPNLPPARAQLMALPKAGGPSTVLVDGLPAGQGLLQLLGNQILFPVNQAELAACDRTLFSLDKTSGRLQAVARGPAPGWFLAHERGVLFWEFPSVEPVKPSQIWILGPGQARRLVGPGGSYLGAVLLGVHGDRFYFNVAERVFRAPLP